MLDYNNVILDCKDEGSNPINLIFFFGRRKPFFETHFCFRFFYSIISFYSEEKVKSVTLASPITIIPSRLPLVFPFIEFAKSGSPLLNLQSQSLSNSGKKLHHLSISSYWPFS